MPADAAPTTPPPETVRLPAEMLETFAGALFAAAGMEADKAARMAHFLLLTDKMGRPTHGLAQAGAYLDQIGKGLMTTTGGPDVVRDTGATIVWDGRYLPGLWLMDEAIEQALSRVAEHGVVTFACSRSHHIGCLAALVVVAAAHQRLRPLRNLRLLLYRIPPPHRGTLYPARAVAHHVARQHEEPCDPHGRYPLAAPA